MFLKLLNLSKPLRNVKIVAPFSSEQQTHWWRWGHAAKLSLVKMKGHNWASHWEEKNKNKKGTTRDQGVELPILLSCRDAAYMLVCLQKEDDVLWNCSHQKNESYVSAARWRGTTAAGSNSATASAPSTRMGWRAERSSRKGMLPQEALVTPPASFPVQERVCSVP